MKIASFTFLSAVLLWMTSAVHGAELRHFNPETLGKSLNEPLSLLLPGSTDALFPWTIETEVKDGRCLSGTVGYPKTISFEEVRSALNERYKRYELESFATEPVMGLWRNEDDG